ncbi:conserved hypothetical protein [Ricinus communis]|uniref:Uncharacterized protein n=1 Tax=Ricinus communis TaxID=3988 RepID=B9RGM0_RICCO|nr:conserved hypothetical protein [Ricinus communis]
MEVNAKIKALQPTNPLCKTTGAAESFEEVCIKLCKERMRYTDKISNIEGVIIGPKSIVDARIPAFVSTNNVVSGSCGGSGRDEDEEAQEYWHHCKNGDGLKDFLFLCFSCCFLDCTRLFSRERKSLGKGHLSKII